jgi:DHA2 family multidrug resistance protein
MIGLTIIVLLSAVSVFGVILFIWRQLTYKYPIVNLSVLKDGNLRLVLMAFILGFGLYGSTLIIPYIRNPFWTATDAGLLLIPGSITTAFMMPIIGKLIQRSAARVHDWCWVLVFFIYLNDAQYDT